MVNRLEIVRTADELGGQILSGSGTLADKLINSDFS